MKILEDETVIQIAKEIAQSNIPDTNGNGVRWNRSIV